MKILIVNGPNLNMLGTREPDQYGVDSYEDIKTELYSCAFELNAEIDIVQSNLEGEIVDFIQKAKGIYDAILINPAAYTHTSVAIRDAVVSVEIPCIEVHLSNIYKREDFRQHSYIAPVCLGQISGLGKNVYKLGLRALVDYLTSH